jgi:biopolymer transport protein ExbD
MKPGLLPAEPETRVQIDVSLAIVNIVLLLILFFLATGRLLNAVETDVTPAETTDLPYDQLPKPLLVIRDDGLWELNQEVIAPENLGPAINERLRSAVTLHILMDGEVSAHNLLQILERPELLDLELRLITLHSGDRE